MTRRSTLVLVALMLALAASRLPARAEQPFNPLLEELTTQGVALAGGKRFLLPAPSLKDGLDAQEQHAKFNDFAKKYVDDGRFFDKSVTAPFVLKMTPLGDGGQQVDVWFVAHGKLETIVDKKLFDELMVATKKIGNQIPEGARLLTPEELAARKLAPAQLSGGAREEYGLVQLSVIEKVHVTGLTYAVSTQTDESLTLSTRMAQDLVEDSEFPGRWRPIRRDAKGDFQLGEAQPYSSFGGYVKATRLTKPSGALLVECHLVYDEPSDWFDGVNLLRSKLPPLVQDRVRSFRRQLAQK